MLYFICCSRNNGVNEEGSILRWCKRYFYITNRNKRSVFLLTDHFVIEECKLCNKEWKSLAIV